MPAETRVPTPTLLGRLRATPGVALVVLLGALAPVLAAAAARGALVYLAEPSLGLTLSSLDGRITHVDHRWQRLRAGDEILAIDGRRVVVGDPVAVRRAILALEPGPVRLTFRHGEGGAAETGEETAPATPYGAAARIGLWTRVATGVGLLLVGLAVFVVQPGRRVTWVFLLFSTGLAVHLLAFLACLPHTPEGVVIEGIGLYLAVAAGVHFFAVFPRPLFARPWRLRALYLLPAAAALVVVPLYRDPRALRLVTDTLRGGSYLAAVGALASTLFVVLQLRRAVEDGDTVARARARSLLVGVGIGLVVPTLLGLVVVGELAWVVKSFLVIVFFVVVVDSILRQNAFEVDRFTAALLGYSSTIALLGAAFAGVLLGLSELLGPAGLPRSPAAGGVVTAGFFLLFSPVYRHVRRRVDRWFLREGIEEEATLEMLRSLADAVRGTDPSLSFEVGMKTAGALHSDRVELWRRYGDRFRSEASSPPGGASADGERPPVAAGGPLARALAGGSGGVGGLVDRPFEPEAQTELWERHLVLAAPIFTAEGLHGFVALGRKQSGAAYTRRERSFVDTVASQLAIAAERTLDKTTRLGPYRLIRRLGTGGMAEVFLAAKSGPGGFELQVAMKRILPHLANDARTQAMFLDEARIAALLRHPNIVRIYGIEEYEGTPFLVMEYMDGPPLSKLLAASRRRGEPLPVAIAARVAEAMLSALDDAHRATDRRGRPLGIVHRDVKPSNLLTSRHGEVKLADFGIARAELRLQQTQPGRVKGTLAYMPPEQREGQPVGTSADIFSAAAVLYECLTGEGPFPDGYRDPPPVGLAAGPGLDRFFARALAEDPERRFASAAEARDRFLEAVVPAKPAAAGEVAALVRDLAPPAPDRTADPSLFTTEVDRETVEHPPLEGGLPPTARG